MFYIYAHTYMHFIDVIWPLYNLEMTYIFYAIMWM